MLLLRQASCPEEMHQKHNISILQVVGVLLKNIFFCSLCKKNNIVRQFNLPFDYYCQNSMYALISTNLQK